MAALLEALLLSLSLSIDAFVSSLSYGSNKISIPMRSVQIITLICSAIIGLSFFAGDIFRPCIPDRIAKIICFVILFIIGSAKLLDSVIKSVIRKHNKLNKELKFSMFNIKFILNLYANPEQADADASKTISPAEAASLAVALSLDGLAVGFGAALGNINGVLIFFSSFASNMTAVLLGCYLGNKAANKLAVNISWISGAVLIILAFTKLFF